MINLLTEDNGNNSATRLMCLIALFAAIVFGAVGIWTDSDIAETLSGTFLAVAFSAKVAQKPFEQKVKQDSLDSKDVDDLK